jgi:hypothetical protein
MTESTCLIDKIRANANASDLSSPTSYVAGLRDAEEYIREIDAMPAALAQIKYEGRQQFLRIMNREERSDPVQSATD